MYAVKKYSYYFIVAAAFLFLLGAPYYRGLFFDINFYWIEGTISIIFLVYILLNFKDFSKYFMQPYVWILLLIPLLYFLAIFRAENQLLAIQQFLRWTLAIQFFLLILIIKEKKWGIELTSYLLILTGIWTAGFGWLGAYQLVDFKDAFLGTRIASVFQYPNTFAAFLVSVLIGTLILATMKKRYTMLLSFPSYLLFITMIFTYSRGAWLVFGAVWIFALFFLSFRQQLLYVFHSIFIGLMGLISLSPLNASIAEKSADVGMKWLALGTLAVGLLYSLLALLINRINIPLKVDRVLRWVIPFLILIAILSGYVLIDSESVQNKLPENLRNRIESINLETSSAVSRQLFYQDAATMIKDHPFFGAGGGAWKQQYERYQSYPYTSREAHNFYFQMAVEIGWIGLLIFLLFALLILWSIIKSRNQLGDEDRLIVTSLVFMLVVLLSHSFIDFNMSYGYMLVLLLVLFGLTALPIEWKISGHGQYKYIKYVAVIMLIILISVNVFYSLRFHYSNQIVKSITKISFDEADQRIEKAIDLNPYELNTHYQKINMYLQMAVSTKNKNYFSTAIQEISSIEEMKQMDSASVLNLAQTYAKIGMLENSVEILTEGLETNPWRKELYDQKIAYSFSITQYYKKENEQKKYQEALQQIKTTYDEIMKKRTYLDQQIPALKYGAFRPSETTRKIIGQVYVIEGNVEEGLKYLVPLTKSKDETIKTEAIAWTAHGYLKLNNRDKALVYYKMADPKKIEELMKEISLTWD